MGKFNTKVSIVTGAARGLGRAPARSGSAGQGLCTRILVILHEFSGKCRSCT